MKKKLTLKSIILLFSLYTTQFLGLGFFLEAFVGILRQNGVPLENLGFIYMLGFFLVLKFLWTPLIDKFHFKKLGHYRVWIIIFLSLMVTTLFLISTLDIIEDLNFIISLAFLYSFFAASVYVSIDAFAYKITFKRERRLINAIKTSGGLIGMVLGGGVGLILYTKIGWNSTLLIIAIASFLTLIGIIFYKERNTKNCEFIEKIDYKQYFTFWKTKQKKLWLIILLLYPATISAAFGITTPLLVDLGWSLDKIGFIVHIIGYGIGFLASFGASYLIQKFGKKNLLIIAAIGQVCAILMFLLLFKHHTNDFLVMFVIGFLYLFYTPSQVIIATIMMDLSSSKSVASQVAVQHSISMFASVFFTSIAVSMSGIFGYEKIIIVSAFIGLLSIYLSTKIEYILKKENYERD